MPVEKKFGKKRTIDFWTGLGKNDNNGILPAYDSGDGTHMNAAGHRILFNRVIDAEVGIKVKNDFNGLSVQSEQLNAASFTVYPNPVTDRCTIQLSKNTNTEAEITLYDLLGKNGIYYDNYNKWWENHL